MFLIIGEKILVPIIVAVILTILAFAWKGITDGTLITFLGGVSQTEFGGNPQLFSLGLKDAVIAFDRKAGCPERWEPFIQAESRTIIGARFDGSFNSELTPRPFREEDKGKEDIILTEDHIPEHKHTFQDIYYSEHANENSKREFERNQQGVIETMPVPGGIGSRGTDRDNVGWIIQHETASYGQGTKFTNMPPYIALFYCKPNSDWLGL